MASPERSFDDSCHNFLHYPKNLVVGRNFDHILAAYTQRLHNENDRLFDEEYAEVAFWELHRGASYHATAFRATTAKELDGLKNHVSGSQKDPLCRHVFLSADNSRAPLNCSGPMLKYMLSYHQTMPHYLDLLFSFGEQDLPRDFYYTSFEQESLPSPHDETTLTLPDQGRSGHEFRQCYNLWSVEKTEKDGVPNYALWQIRQTATYHAFDTESGNSLWISMKANDCIRKRIEAATKSFPPMQQQSMLTFEGAFAANLFTHLISFEWCTSKSAAPTNALTGPNIPLQQIQGTGGLAAAKQPNSSQSDPFKPLNLFTFGEYQTLQRIGERLQEAHLVIGLNIGIIDKIASSYGSLAKSDEIPPKSRKAVKSHVSQFLCRCASIRQNLKTQQQRLEVQIQILEGTKSLFNNIMEFRNTEINKSFALNQYWSNMTMQKIAQRTAHETASMHIITLVTLIFLPGTFVATFFNGGNFNWDSGDAGGPPWHFNSEVFELFMEVSLPLMAFVIIVWFGAYWWARGTSRKELEDIEVGKIS
ncbi:hypothetical protein PG985_005082 [Apiospora marii]|uniref:uncharacterized protein n=1 Tax=Apiospora marii TaxID=335849 RepID=UPI00312F2C80